MNSVSRTVSHYHYGIELSLYGNGRLSTSKVYQVFMCTPSLYMSTNHCSLSS